MTEVEIKGKCTIEQFRDLITTYSDLIGVPKREFNLIIDVNGDSEIINTYKLEMWTGKEWIELYKEDDFCKLNEFIKDMIKFEREK